MSSPGRPYGIATGIEPLPPTRADEALTHLERRDVRHRFVPDLVGRDHPSTRLGAVCDR
jgi:hypothetical protein